LLKDNARKFGSGGQTLTPRHTIDAILGLKNRNGTGNGRNAEAVSDGKSYQIGAITPYRTSSIICPLAGDRWLAVIKKANRFQLPTSS